MKATFLPRSPVDALFLALLLWLGCGVSVYLVTINSGKPLFAYLVLLVFTIAFFCMQGATTHGLGVFRNRWTRRFLLWLLLYGTYGIVAFLESSQSDNAVQALIDLLEGVVVASAFSVLMCHSRRLWQSACAIALLAIFASGMNVFDFFDPIFTGVPGRGAGFYINPNISGEFVPLAMLCGLPTVPKRFRWTFVMACGIGVLVTFSREAWLMWGMAVAWLGWQLNKAHPMRRLVGVTLSVVLAAWFLVAIFSGVIGGWLAGTGLSHYLDSNTLARLGVGGMSLADDASVQRLGAALYAWHQITLAPLLGHGIGYVYEWDFPVGPHNMFLRFMAEGGIFGLLLYLGLFWLLWRATEGFGRIAVLLFLIASFFSHNLLDEPEFQIILTFVFVEAALRRPDRIEQVEAQRMEAVA